MADQEVNEVMGTAEVYEESLDAVVLRLAALPLLEYATRWRKQEAKRLDVPMSLLDEAVTNARRRNESDNNQSLVLPEPEPWPEPVDGDDLLDQLCRAFKQHLALPNGADLILALWAIHSHCFDTGMVSPRLVIKSPEKRCGKTTALTILGRLVPRPLPVANITAAAIFRTVEAARPTILIDEADTFLNSDDLRGILNSGHYKPSAFVVRTAGDDHEPRQFSTWACVAIALIGSLRDTLEDRSVIVEMWRRRPDEEVQRLRLDRLQHLDRLGSMAVRWAQDHTVALGQADPDMPEQLHDRAADNWRPLLAIADLAGGDWPERARQVAVATSGDPDESSVRTQLLADIYDIFNEKGVEKIFSEDICNDLATREDRPWPEWKNGRAITQMQLARQLKLFKIKPKSIRINAKTAKGYELGGFVDAFATYLPARNVTPSQPAETLSFSQNLSVTNRGDVTDKKPLEAAESLLCDVVTDEEPRTWETIL
jgi:putative DNA primase/helicase